MGKDTRTYSGHWDAYIHGPDHQKPPSRWRWIKDAAIAGVAAFFLGYAIGVLIVDGFVPAIPLSVGALVLVIHVGVLSLGQRVDSTRYNRSDLVRIGASGAVAFGFSIVIGIMGSI